MALTMPQIILLGHAAQVNKKRMDASTSPGSTPLAPASQQGDPIIYRGKRWSEMNSYEQAAYAKGGS